MDHLLAIDQTLIDEFLFETGVLEVISFSLVLVVCNLIPQRFDDCFVGMELLFESLVLELEEVDLPLLAVYLLVFLSHPVGIRLSTFITFSTQLETQIPVERLIQILLLGSFCFQCVDHL